LNKPAEAKQAFVIYLDELQQFKAQFSLSESQIWLSTLVDEIDWAQKMVFKADKL
jgi:hypothetical protein